MIPFYFGAPRRRLFGIHTPAAARAGRPRAAVLCQALGDEYIYAHRSMRQLANRLQSCGFHTLRFDYFGTGDSAGEECDIGADGLQADVVAAIETVNDLAATDKVTLIGLRAGANVAASAAAGLPAAIEALVLWEPIFPEDPCRHSAPHELRPLDLAALPQRSLILVTQSPSSRERSGPVPTATPAGAIERLPAPSPWTEAASTSGVIPVRVIQRIEEWLR